MFGDYISNVLPELGEESVAEIGMETLAGELLDGKYRFQTFLEQTATLLDSSDTSLRKRIEVKSAPGFLETLDEYADHVERTAVHVEDVWLGRRLVPAWFFDETFRRNRGLAPASRVARVVDATEQNIGIHYNHDLTTEERAELRTAVRKMYQRASLRDTYKDLFAWLGQPELFKLAKGAKLEWSDVFPLIYLKMRLEGIHTERRNVKHLLVDEMQDYTPVQYTVIARLFPCKKTILGDANQSVNPYGSSTAADIHRVFRQASSVKLCKSYRSTYEITQFAQRISPNPDLVAIERHGEAPQVLRCSSKAAEVDHVCRIAREFGGSGHTTLGIICKTQKQAERLHEALAADGVNARLLTAQSTSFTRGLIVCTAHMAKGLEFDHVIVPDASERNYDAPMDRNLLYVACTRAMHRLVLTFTGEPTGFLG